MNIILTGGTGLIGKRVIAHLLGNGHSVVALTRQRTTAAFTAFEKKPFRAVQWDARTLGSGDSAWSKEISGAEAIIHLAGEGIFDKRWTAEIKHRLVESRLATTRLFVEAIAQADTKPRVFISASAVGYYGDRHDAPTDESTPPASDFLADLCVRWEQEAQEARKYGVRVAHPRLGIVLAESGGALGRMLPVFKAFLGMPLGSGKQWFPWVHIDDVVRGICFPLENTTLEGAYNLAAPEPVRMEEFCMELGNVLHRPSWSPMRVPEFALKLALGEAALSLIGGVKIIPKKLLDLNFEFRYNKVAPALDQLLRP